QEVKMKKIEGFLVPPRQDPKGNRKKDFGGFSLQAVWNTLYTETQAHQLMRRHAKQQGIKYDYVIRTRPDIALQEPFLLDRYLPFFAMGTNDTGVFFPLEYVAHGAVNNASKEFIILHPRAFDVFYITTPQAMDKMMTILDHFDLFFRQLPNQFPTMPSSISNIWNIEVLFLWHIQREGILPHFAKLEYLIKRKKSIYDGRTVFPKSTGGHQAVLPPSPLVGWPRRILLTIYWHFVFLHKPWRLLKRIVKRGD
ncbi:MAG: hypothetical protein ORN57_00395, partial [Alphaproteobacteria bacterium]|nr:hypothetical protein [Alphaproteobacteria bacterium]